MIFIFRIFYFHFYHNNFFYLKKQFSMNLVMITVRLPNRQGGIVSIPIKPGSSIESFIFLALHFSSLSTQVSLNQLIPSAEDPVDSLTSSKRLVRNGTGGSMTHFTIQVMFQIEKCDSSNF